MLTQLCKTTAAETASGRDPNAAGAARLWARMLCGLAAIVDLFTALRTRLPNQLGNIPSDPNIDKTTPDGNADAPAKGDTGGQDAECSTAVSKDDADGKTATSRSTDEGEGKDDESPNKRGRGKGESRGRGKGRGKGKNRGRQTERRPKNKRRRGKGRRKGRGKCKCKCSGKCKCTSNGRCKCTGRGKCKCGGNGKNKAGNAGSNVNDATLQGIMRMLAGGLCMNLGLVLLAGLGVKFSDDIRAKYDLSDMYRMLVAMCCDGKENSTAEHQYQASLGSGGVRLPSRSWLYKKLGGVRNDYMLKRCQRMLRRSVLRAKRHGMLRHPVIVAIDEHDIPFHAKVMKMGLALFSRGKKGTIKFNRIITIFCVVDGQRITLGAEVLRSQQDQAAAVGRLLKQCRDSGIRISLVIMDRGYYSTGVMATVREAGHPMLMPAVKHDNIKDEIKKFDAGELDAISERAISSGDRSETFRLIILRRQKPERSMSAEHRALLKLHEKQVRVEDKYYVFATTLPDSRINGDPKNVADLYKMRWGIENSYKSYEQLRPWTTSNKLSVRILLWFIPFILYHLWLLARFLTAKRTGVAGGRPPLTLSLFVKGILNKLNDNARSGRPPD